VKAAAGGHHLDEPRPSEKKTKAHEKHDADGEHPRETDGPDGHFLRTRAEVLSGECRRRRRDREAGQITHRLQTHRDEVCPQRPLVVEVRDHA
jgi:hypothetical protein